jgi:YVTN family beta-propeller protein
MTRRRCRWALAGPTLLALSAAVVRFGPTTRAGDEPRAAQPSSSAERRAAQPAAPVEPHRSPADVALVGGGRLAVSANHTSHTVSLVDLSAGKVLDEVGVGQAPWAIAASPDGKLVAVANLRSDSVSLPALDAGRPALTPGAEIPVGHEPRSVAFNDAGSELYVALGGADEIAVVDVRARKVVRRFASGGREPRALALWPDGRTLWAVNSRSGQVVRLDRITGEVLRTITLHDAGNMNRIAIGPDGSMVLAGMVRRSLPVSRGNIAEGWVIDNRLTRLTPEPDRSVEQVALDERGDALGDLFAAAFTPDGKRLAVTVAGTHEMLILDAARIPWTIADPGDLIDSVLLNPQRMRRIALGGRPMGLAVAGDGRSAVVANYLSDSLQVVSLIDGQLQATIRLGGPAKSDPARVGEAIFYDAKRSHAAWFSCNTCHVEGHTNGMLFDTLNDESYGDPKIILSLRGAARTGPWTWHGLQKDLAASVRKSMITTMSGPAPTDDDVAALTAFLKTLEHPRNPNRGAGGELSPAAKRGEAVFFGKANCSECHGGPQYTSSRVYHVDTQPEPGPHGGFNPPSLRGLHARGPYLHDGRAGTLDELLTRHHVPEKLRGRAITEAERRDLIEFLNSL